MPRLALAATILTCNVALSSCDRQTKPERRAAMRAVVETQWTRRAAETTEMLIDAALKQDPKTGALKYSLPQLRVYDAKGQLVYLLDPTRGWKPDSIGTDIDRAIASGRTVAGPSLEQTLADLQTADGQPAVGAVAVHGTPLVFDYWASWCVPCKFLEQALLRWQKMKPADSVQIVKAEADLMKLARERGEKVFMTKSGPDGKLHKIEVK